MELELEKKEAPVGDFSLDLLAKYLGMGSWVIVENQLTQTDHGRIGKLLTYAAGLNASTVVWVAETTLHQTCRETIRYWYQTRSIVNYYKIAGL